MSTTPITAKYHHDLADAYEVEMQALSLLLTAARRRRDAHRAMEAFFTPPAVPFPTIVAPAPAGPDPDFEDAPPSGPDASDEAAP